jgi:hypothetical protein
MTMLAELAFSINHCQDTSLQLKFGECEGSSAIITQSSAWGQRPPSRSIE